MPKSERTVAGVVIKERYLSDRIYDVLRFFSRVVFSGVATAYFAVSSVMTLPATYPVVCTLIAIDLFVGAILIRSDVSYDRSGAKYAGTMLVQETETSLNFTLALNENTNLEDIHTKKDITFKVETTERNGD